MTSAAEKISPAYGDHYGQRDPRGENVVPFAPFVDPHEAERVMAEGEPSDELHSFLRRSLGILDGRTRAEAVQPAPAPVALPPEAAAYGFRHAAERAPSDLSPQHPAYETQRPAHFDMPFQNREPVREPEPAVRYASQAAPLPHGYPLPPVPPRPAPVDVGAPSGDPTAFEIPSFLRARPGIPLEPVVAPAPEPVRPQPPAPAPEPAKVRRPNHAALRSVFGDLAWLYSVFPAIIVLQIVGGFVWTPLSSVAAGLAFLAYAAAWALWRPSLFQLRVSAGWQLVVTVAAFRSLDVASPEQWMHMFAGFAATAVVLVAMGGVEVFQRLRAR